MSEAVREARDPMPRMRHVITLAAAVLLALVMCVARGPHPFLYDAEAYWTFGQQLLRQAIPDVGYRGVLTMYPYLPAAFAAKVLGLHGGGWAVLAENTLIILGLGAFVIPGIVSRWAPMTPPIRAVSIVLVAFVLGGFATVPLMDLWALTLVLLALWVSDSRLRGSLAWTGLLLAMASNLRPAYLGFLVLAFVVILLHRHRSWWLYPVGLVLGFLPQLIANLTKGIWLPWPPATTEIQAVQLQYSAHIVRYDTVLEGTPTLFWCSPEMSQRLNAAPESFFDLAGVLVRELPVSLVFAIEKITTSHLWSLAMPYWRPHLLDVAFGTCIIAVSIFGFAWLVRGCWDKAKQPRPLASTLAVVLFLITLVTLVASTPEARFAAPSVAVGLLGVVGWVASPKRPTPVVVTVILTCVVILSVVTSLYAMAHPTTTVPATMAVCRIC